MENFPEHAGFDIPSGLDRKYEDVVPKDYWASTTTARELLLQRLTAFNQYKNPKTKSWCGWYWLTHTENAMRILEDVEWGTKNQTDPAWRWIDRNENERPAPSKWNGTSLQGNLNIFRNKGRISGYAYANSKEETMRAIDNWHLIYTGTNQCNWAVTYRTGIFTPAGKTVIGHLFSAVEYEDDWLIIRESNWPKRWKILIKWDDIHYLYSRVAVIPNSNADLILKYRTMSQFQKEVEISIQKWFTNGADPKAPALREQVGVVWLRAYEKAKQDAKEEILSEVYKYIDEKVGWLTKLLQDFIAKK